MADKVVLDGELSPVLPFDGDFSLDIPLAGELGIVTQTGGGGGSAVLIEKTVNNNGVYNASADSADGYSKVTVAVPASAVDTGTKSVSITENGTTSEDVTGYASASITVNVPNTYTSADEGKVVDGGALVGQTSLSVTENDTYDTTTVNEVTVNVPGGASITDGTEVLARNANSYPTSIKHYGTKVYPQQYWNRTTTDGPYKNLASVTFADTVTEIMSYGFAACAALTALDVSTVVTAGGNSLQDCKLLATLVFSALTSAGNYMLSGCTGLTAVTMPLVTNYNAQRIFNGCTGLQTVQMGNIGHAVTAVGNQAFYGCSQSSLTITVYTTGDKVSTLLTNIRNSATAATIVFKASENTTYGGVSYAAGDTMLTSTP